MKKIPAELCVREIRNLYPSLGIPHFQRGEVWGTENKALLLESLFYGTPCGTLILWRPKAPTAEGIAFGSDARHLIIDGQQRVRALVGIFEPRQASDGSAGRDPEAESALPKAWCLNLSRVPGLETLFESGLTRYPMFTLVPDPRHPKARIRHNLLPLESFFEPQTRDAVLPLLKPSKGGAEDAAWERLAASGLPERMRAMQEHKLFFCKVLTETRAQNRLSDVVSLYNRINSAGKRVEGQERAFATLVAMSPDTNNWLADLFTRVHGASVRPGSLEGRDEVLRREKERAFGFALFIRTFVQVASYYFNVGVGANAFSFDVVNGQAFRHLSSTDAARFERLRTRTTGVVVAMRMVLRDLFIDDLRSLPETSALLPVFQMFIRFAPLADGYVDGTLPVADREAIQGLALRLLLADLTTQSRPLKLVKSVNEAPTEAPRDSRRPHFLGGWGLWDVRVGFLRRCVSAPFGW